MNKTSIIGIVVMAVVALIGFTLAALRTADKQALVETVSRQQKTIEDLQQRNEALHIATYKNQFGDEFEVIVYDDLRIVVESAKLYENQLRPTDLHEVQ